MSETPTPRHISEVLAEAVDEMHQGNIYDVPSLAERDQRDANQQPELTKAEIIELQGLIDSGQATYEQLLAYEEQRALDTARIEQKAENREQSPRTD